MNIAPMNQIGSIYQQQLYPTKPDNKEYIRSLQTIKD